jgi:hypothetical protein
MTLDLTVLRNNRTVIFFKLVPADLAANRVVLRSGHLGFCPDIESPTLKAFYQRLTLLRRRLLRLNL